jgi:lipopolysaccharide biosynthesis protein
MKVLAFYLPQFHPIPENDAWWQKGFTEWTNVTKSRPRFKGHYQPHLPADLGFYDLRLEETRAAQAELARANGIDGFCYYHYWFNGKRLLQRPFDAVLSSGKPDFPFCLCWANESWTRNWSGENRMVLQAQEHSVEDDDNHIRWLLRAFEDERYIKLQGRPLMLVYRADLLGDAAATVKLWRNRAREHGFPDLFLGGVLNNFSKVDESAMFERFGFDAVIEFQPQARHLPKPAIQDRVRLKLSRTLNALALRFGGDASNPPLQVTERLDYEQFVNNAVAALQRRSGDLRKIFPTVLPSWDNSSRRRDGARVVQNVDPRPYQRWLEAALDSAAHLGDDSIVFINAWNEWAEGCHLEPDQKVGHGFLEATKRAVERHARRLVPDRAPEERNVQATGGASHDRPVRADAEAVP